MFKTILKHLLFKKKHHSHHGGMDIDFDFDDNDNCDDGGDDCGCDE